MRYQYVVILRKGSERATDVLSLLLCLFSALVFVYTGLPSFSRLHGAAAPGAASGGGWTPGAASPSWLSLATGVLLLAGLALILILRRRVRRQFPYKKIHFRYLLLLAAAGWLALTPVPWIGAFFGVLAFLEYQTKRPLEIGFDNDRVVINTLFKQRFDWEAFNNVILKDGLLTLDFKNNRLIQREVTEDDEEDDADEEEFNAYCRARLAAAAASSTAAAGAGK